VPTRARRWRELVERDVWEQREKYGTLGEVTVPHRLADLQRFPTMCRRAGLDVDPATAAEITEEQVLAVKRCGLWRTNTLRPIFSGLRGLCQRNGNAELASLAAIWRLPKETEDRRMWLTAEQLSSVHGKAEGRVKVLTTLGGFLGMREDSSRSIRVEELHFSGAIPTLSFAAKGPDGRRMTLPLNYENAKLLRSWVECQGLGPRDRVYRWSHATFDGDLRSLGKRAGLPFPLSGHVLRRSWARVAYLADPNFDQVRRIQKVLGHSSVEQTLWYIGTPLDDMAVAFASFNERMRAVACPKEA